LVGGEVDEGSSHRVIVLILVALLWIAVLVPTLLSKLAERRSAGSIGRFHQRLDLLERTGPKLVQPAYRLTGTESSSRSTVPLVVPVSPPPVRPTLTLVSNSDPSPERESDVETRGSMIEEEFTGLRIAVADDRVASDDHRRSSKQDRAAQLMDRRRLARRRRRDVFAVLCALTAVTSLMGLAHPLRGAWVAAGIFVALLAGFIALAAYGQHIEAERRHLVRLGRPEPAAVVAEPTAIRYLSEADLDRYYEQLSDDEETDDRLVAEG
jgi:hypothetical protein